MHAFLGHRMLNSGDPVCICTTSKCYVGRNVAQCFLQFILPMQQLILLFKSHNSFNGNVTLFFCMKICYFGSILYSHLKIQIGLCYI